MWEFTARGSQPTFNELEFGPFAVEGILKLCSYSEVDLRSAAVQVSGCWPDAVLLRTPSGFRCLGELGYDETSYQGEPFLSAILSIGAEPQQEAAS